MLSNIRNSEKSIGLMTISDASYIASRRLINQVKRLILLLYTILAASAIPKQIVSGH